MFSGFHLGQTIQSISNSTNKFNGKAFILAGKKYSSRKHTRDRYVARFH